MIDRLALLIRQQLSPNSLERIICPACPYKPKMSKACRAKNCLRLNSEEGSRAMAEWMMALVDAVVEAEGEGREDMRAYLAEGADEHTSFADWKQGKG